MKILGFKDKNKSVEVDKEREDELRLINDFKNKFEVARMAKAEKVKVWNKCIDAYNSDYFKNMNKPEYKSDEISNFIFSTLETIKPIMVDNDPKIVVLPKSPNGIQASDKIQNIFDAEWTRAKMGRKLPQGITIALQIGTAIFGFFWDGKDENGLGNVNPTLINPYNFFPDPMATDVDNAEYIIYATYKHVNVLRQKFPSKASLLDGGTINFKELVSQGTETSSVQNQVLVLECWTRDYTTYDEEVKDPENEAKTVKIRKNKYPKGRVITIAPDLNIVLDDKANPYDDGKFPFKLLKCYDVPFEFWGKGEIEQLLSPQTYINDLTNQIIDNAKLTANMPWVLDKNSGIGKGQLTNRPGLIVRKNPGTQVQRLQPPQMPAYVQEVVETLKRDIEIISGVHDVTQGRKPGSVSAASAIVALQEAAQARIRLKVKLMELMLGDAGSMWYNRIKQFWNTNRWVRRDDMANGYTKPEDMQNMFVEISPVDLQVDVDFIIVAGSTMPQNKNAMLDLMIRLAQTMGEDGLPMVDRETVLAYTNVPDKKKIIQRINEISGVRKGEQQNLRDEEFAKQQMMQQQQAQAQQAQMAQQHASQQEQIAMKGKMDAEATAPSDAQLKEVITFLMQNPQLLQQVVAMSQQGGMMQGT